MIFLTILIVPLIITLLSFMVSQLIRKKQMDGDKNIPYSRMFDKNEITMKEFLVQFGVVLLTTGLCTLIVSCQNLTYTEIWNSYVTGKESKKVSCRHSYSCNCRRVCSGSGKSRSCRRVCDTCYEHSYDVDWEINDGTGRTYDIDTVDRRGLIMPEFWAMTRIGDPVSYKHSYKNYIKASSDSLFRKQGLIEKYKKVLPNYPDKIYNYYNLDRIIDVNVNLSQLPMWNRELSKINSKVGAARQCNAIVVIVENQPREYLYALNQFWLGGNKNDAILVISTASDGSILWADVIALVSDSLFNVSLREGVEEVDNIIQMDRILKIFHENIMKYYKRKEMKDFEYLTATITPTVTQYVVIIILNIIISISLSIFFHKEDFL